jgi:hypothetical protein
MPDNIPAYVLPKLVRLHRRVLRVWPLCRGPCASPALNTFPCISRQHILRTRIRHSNHPPLVQARCRSPASERGWKDRSLQFALKQDWDVSSEYVRYLLIVAESIGCLSCTFQLKVRLTSGRRSGPMLAQFHIICCPFVSFDLKLVEMTSSARNHP